MLVIVDTVGDLMTRDVLTIDPADSLGEAAEKMIDRSVGALVVSDFGNIIGILTERDILRAAAHRTSSAETRVRQWMTPEVITVPPSMPAGEAAQTMLERNFRHLPVVENGRPVGIVSMRDLARWSVQSDITPG
jgi:CBS domain-containing protein